MINSTPKGVVVNSPICEYNLRLFKKFVKLQLEECKIRHCFMSSIGFSKFIMKPLFNREYLLVHFIWEKGCNISKDWMKSTVSKELTSQRREILHFYRWAQLTNWSNKLLLQKYLALNRNGLNENPAKCYCPWEFWVQLFKPPRSVVKIVGEEGCVFVCGNINSPAFLKIVYCSNPSSRMKTQCLVKFIEAKVFWKILYH